MDEYVVLTPEAFEQLILLIKTSLATKPTVQASPTDLTAGVSELPSGEVYLVYE